MDSGQGHCLNNGQTGFSTSFIPAPVIKRCFVVTIPKSDQIR